MERPERRVHDRRLETIFGTVDVERMGYARAGHDSLPPLDASLNLPGERWPSADRISMMSFSSILPRSDACRQRPACDTGARNTVPTYDAGPR